MTDPLNALPAPPAEKDRSGGRPGDLLEGMRLTFADRPGPPMLLLEVDHDERRPRLCVPGGCPCCAVFRMTDAEVATALQQEADAAAEAVRRDELSTALSKPGDRPTTAREAEAMELAAVRAGRPPAV
jgi:hypothetical protein